MLLLKCLKFSFDLLLLLHLCSAVHFQLKRKSIIKFIKISPSDFENRSRILFCGKQMNMSICK